MELAWHRRLRPLNTCLLKYGHFSSSSFLPNFILLLTALTQIYLGLRFSKYGHKAEPIRGRRKNIYIFLSGSGVTNLLKEE